MICKSFICTLFANVIFLAATFIFYPLIQRSLTIDDIRGLFVAFNSCGALFGAAKCC